MFFFSDFPAGATGILPPKLVTREETIAFAREFDPQPMHLDEAAAAKSLLGGLSASGWHTCAMLMRMICDGFLNNTAGAGSPGLKEVRWLKPVKPGDTLTATYTVAEARLSKSRPDIGVCRLLYDVKNQDAVTVMTWDCTQFFLAAGDSRSGSRRPAVVPSRAEVAGETVHRAPSGIAASGPLPGGESDAARKDSESDVAGKIGSHTFTADAIIAFATLYDPQPFHLSQAAGETSSFGGLIASGWHTAAIWMKLMIAHVGREAAAARARGERPPRLGPSPGFRDMRWLAPVRPGDTLAYSSRPLRTEERPGRPDWELLFMQNEARNQRGELVFSFEGRVLVEKVKPAAV